jgi:hypothetical protein
MTAVPNELARKQPANAPARRNPQVIEGEARPTRPDTGSTVAATFAMFLLALLFAGFLLSMWQQAS